MIDQNLSPIQNAELFEIKVTNTSQSRVNFPDMPTIRGKRITAMEIMNPSDCPKGPSFSPCLGATNPAAFTSGFITLHTKGKEKIKDIPISAFRASNYQGVLKNFSEGKKLAGGANGEDRGIVIDPQKSYVTFSDTSVLTAGEVLLIVFFFLD